MVVCCLSCGAPGAGAYLEKIGFRMEGVSIFAFGPSARAAQQPRRRDEKKDHKKPKRAANSARGKDQTTRSKIIIFGSCKLSEIDPKAPQSDPGSVWKRLVRKVSDNSRPRTSPGRLQSLPSPSGGQCDFRKRLRVTGFAHPGPLGTDNYQRKAI